MKTTAPSIPTPDEVVATLKANLKSSRAHKHLDNVHEVCCQIHAGNTSGTHQFSIVNVARRLSRADKGPSLNTLRAVAGAHFRKLIHCWASHAPTQSAKRDAKRLTEHRELLLQIPNIAARSEVAFLLAQGARARVQLDELKGIANIVVDLRPKVSPSKELEVLPGTAGLLDAERDAIKQVFDIGRLRRFGIQSTDNGSLVVGKSVLFSAGFLTGIRKLLGDSARDNLAPPR